jgi:hypothetical protein
MFQELVGKHPDGFFPEDFETTFSRFAQQEEYNLRYQCRLDSHARDCDD